MKFVSWNVNGLRACAGKGFSEIFRELDADFFCLQETKMQAGQLDLQFEGYQSFWNYAEKKGYSGTAIYTKHQPLSVTYGIGIFTDIHIVHNDSLSNAISTLRMTKDEEEVECIRKAQEIAEKALEELKGFIRVGVTEREIALELNRLMFAYGAEDLSFDTIVLSGANTSMPHGVPSDKKVEEGEFVLIDFGAVYNGYHSDMTRTLCVGEPSEEMKKVYNIVLEAQLAGIEAAKAGILGSELDKISRDVIEQAGYGSCFGHSLGHGVGMEIHEKPNASPNYKLALNKGAVVTVEPGIYIAGKFGVRIEDFVILTENGCENLTKSAKNLITL